MGKKLIDIRKEIDSSGMRFYQYLEHLLPDELFAKLLEISNQTDVYLFSGIIRNFFLKHYFKRDVDVVIGSNIDVYKVFAGEEIKKNSFGGYKILFPSGPLDLWFIKDTWAFKYRQTTLDFNLEMKIPETAFFNFSAIIFSFNKKEFHYTDDFVKFLQKRELDYVFKENPNYALCIVNTVYYSEKYNLKISDRLLFFIKDIYQKFSFDLNKVQEKHFGEILYSRMDIEKVLFNNFFLADQT